MTVRPTPIAIAVVERAGQYLIGRRPPGVPLAGLCEFPGGKVHADETPEQAAVRECLEETGLAVRVTGLRMQVTHTYEHGTLDIHFFACVPEDEAALPAAPFAWVDARGLADREFPEANAVLIESLLGHDRKEGPSN